MELSWNTKEPFTLQSGESRTYLEDGDTVVLKGFSGAGK
jgi:fumarylacetoacetase